MTYRKVKREIEILRERIKGYEKVLLPKYIKEDIDIAMTLQDLINKLYLDIELKEEFIKNAKKRIAA
jgi:hypothetical protein